MRLRSVRVLGATAVVAMAAACASAPPMRALGMRPEMPATPAPLAGEALARAVRNGDLIARHLPRLEYHGGAFIRRPRVVTITFADDDPSLVRHVERFGAAVARTSWWRSVTADYCVESRGCIGSGRDAWAVRLDERLPDDLHAVDLVARVARRAEAGDLGATDAETTLLVYLPPRVRLHDAFVPRYCGKGPHAFHRPLRLATGRAAIAVMPRCGDAAALTGTASHELLEMVTNPDTADRGFAFLRSGATAGFTAAGLEPADPCGLVAADNTLTVDGFVVRRAWSNRAARRGHDPCAPASRRQAFVALVPREPGVRLRRADARVTIVLTAAADRPVGAWSVRAAGVGPDDAPTCVEAVLDATTVGTGETVSLTLTRRPDHASGGCVVRLLSTLHGRTSAWPVSVRLE